MSSQSLFSSDRRTVLKGAGATAAAFAALPALSALLADPALAQAAAAMTSDVQTTTPDGKTVTAALALPDGDGPHPAVLLVHEWWGLNDQIRTMAVEFARLGYVALAVDLYDGSVATTPERAKQLSGAVQGPAALDTVAGWVNWLNSHDSVSKTIEGRAKLGTIGWCFGGTWSLNTSIAHPVDATVVYYGKVNRPATDLAHLNGPVMGHFAKRDQWITASLVKEFTDAMAEVGKTPDVFWYDADHAFANPTGNRYDAEDAALAWTRTTDFLAKNLKG
jgi:carboxymethylenebutenolidase